MKKHFEMQGPDIVPDDIEDIVFVRNQNGELVELDVPDDPEEDGEVSC